MESRNRRLFKLIIICFIVVIISLLCGLLLIYFDNKELEDRIKTLSFKLGDKYDIESIDNEIAIYQDLDKRVVLKLLILLLMMALMI